MGIDHTFWGGPAEIQKIADKLHIKIQEHTPNPDDSQQLVQFFCTTPHTGSSSTTLHLVIDTPFPEEAIDEKEDTVGICHGNVF